MEKDKLKIKKELCSSKVFDYIPGCQHRTFCGIKSNAALKVDSDKYIAWLIANKNYDVLKRGTETCLCAISNKFKQLCNSSILIGQSIFWLD